MAKYWVRLSGDGIVNAIAYVEAETKEDAEKQALAKADDLEWELASLHEEPYVESSDVKTNES